jgi:alpha-N-acetylglucosaminidase
MAGATPPNNALTGGGGRGSPTRITKSGLHDPIGSVQGLIARVLGPQYVSSFQLEVVPPQASGADVFELDGVPGTNTVIVRGSAGYAIASGLNWWMKYTANVSVTWGRNGSGNSVSLLPAPGALPLPAPLSQPAPVTFRYAYNVCTYGYSMPWWDFGQFEEEIDRLALWGVNLPLAFQGQENTWDRFYRSLGLNESEIGAFFAGPAFLPWMRMGNMQGWGGPLPSQWHSDQYALQTAILTRMRSFGMTPVLAGFAGHVPRAMQAHYPNAKFQNSPDWCGFPPQYGSDALLEPTDPLFTTIGAQFHKMVLEDYGDPTGLETPIFNADQFNEMEPSNGTSAYLTAANAAVYSAMTAANPRSVYLMQAWLFHDGFWTFDRVQAYLAGVPIGGMIILDLNSEEGPVWQQYNSFFGHTWIWNSLITYGGRRGIYGDLDRLATQPYIDHANSSEMHGIGFTPEATEMIPSQFDIALEAGWRSGPVDPEAWLQQWAVRRYGKESASLSAAHTVLRTAAYNSDIDTASLEDYPSIADSMSHNTNASGLLAALQLYITAATSGEVPMTGPLSYDVTDLNRQVLVNLFSDAHAMLGARYRVGDAAINRTASVLPLIALCQGLLMTLDTTLGADVNFLLGTWIADAARWGNGDPTITAQWVFNARNQITLWGPDGEINDYAAKNGWAGLVSTYYATRWDMLFAAMATATVSGVPFDQGSLDAALLAFEKEWGTRTDERPNTVASGASPITLAQATVSAYATFDASAWTAIPNTDVITPPRSKVFVNIGTQGQAAVSGDCPFVAHGDSSSLANCFASCLANNQCNAVNWSRSAPDCVFRDCSDPLHPVLSPGYGDYQFWGNNETAHSPLIVAAWHTDAGVLGTLCATDPGCGGFSSGGRLYTDTSTRAPAPGVTLYVRA